MQTSQDSGGALDKFQGRTVPWFWVVVGKRFAEVGSGPMCEGTGIGGIPKKVTQRGVMPAVQGLSDGVFDYGSPALFSFIFRVAAPA